MKLSSWKLSFSSKLFSVTVIVTFLFSFGLDDATFDGVFSELVGKISPYTPLLSMIRWRLCEFPVQFNVTDNMSPPQHRVGVLGARVLCYVFFCVLR